MHGGYDILCYPADYRDGYRIACLLVFVAVRHLREREPFGETLEPEAFLWGELPYPEVVAYYRDVMAACSHIGCERRADVALVLADIHAPPLIDSIRIRHR